MDNPGLKRLNASDPKTAIRVVQRRTADYSGSPTTVYDNAQGQPRTQNSDSPGTDSVTPYEQMQHNVDVQVGPPASGVVTPNPASAANGAQPAISDQAQKDLAARRQPGQGASPTNPAWVDAQQQIRQRQQTEQSMRGAHPLFQPRVSAYDEDRGEWLYNIDHPDYMYDDAAPSIHDHTNQPMFNVVQQYYHHPDDLDENDMLHPETEGFWGLGTRYEEDGESRRYRDQIAREGAYDPERGEWTYDVDNPNYHQVDPPPSRSGWSAMPMVEEFEDHDHDPDWEYGSKAYSEDEDERQWRDDGKPKDAAHDYEDRALRQRFAAWDPNRNEWTYDIDRSDYYRTDPAPSSFDNTSQPLYQLKNIEYEEPGQSYLENEDGYLTSRPRMDMGEAYRHPGYPACVGCRENGEPWPLSPDHPIHHNPADQYSQYSMAHPYQPDPEETRPGERLAAFDEGRQEFLYDIDNPKNPRYWLSDPPPSLHTNTKQPMYQDKKIPYEEPGYDSYTENAQGFLTSQPRWEESWHHTGWPACAGCRRNGYRESMSPDNEVHDMDPGWSPDERLGHHHYEPIEDLPSGERLAAYDPQRKEWLYNVEDDPSYYQSDPAPSYLSDSAQPMYGLKHPDVYSEIAAEIGGEASYPEENHWGYVSDPNRVVMDQPMFHPDYRPCLGCMDLSEAWNSQAPDAAIHTRGSKLYHHEYTPGEDTKPGERLAAYDRQRKEFLYDIDEPDYFNQDFPPSAWADTAQPMFQLKHPDVYSEIADRGDDDSEPRYPREDENGYARDVMTQGAWDHPGFKPCRTCDPHEVDTARYPPNDPIHDPGHPWFDHKYSPTEDTKPSERL